MEQSVKYLFNSDKALNNPIAKGSNPLSETEFILIAKQKFDF